MSGKEAIKRQDSVTKSAENLLLAVPKKGRLYDAIVGLLKGSGVSWIRVRATLFCAYCCP